jgi:hypothetical protein
MVNRNFGASAISKSAAFQGTLDGETCIHHGFESTASTRSWEGSALGDSVVIPWSKLDVFSIVPRLVGVTHSIGRQSCQLGNRLIVLGTACCSSSALRNTQRVGSTFACLWALWLFIGFVSAYDCYLTLKYAVSLNHLEQNGIAASIMSLDPSIQVQLDSVALFCGLKCGGTVLVIGLLSLLFNYKREWSAVATYGVFGFQAWLLSCLYVPF